MKLNAIVRALLLIGLAALVAACGETPGGGALPTLTPAASEPSGASSEATATSLPAVPTPTEAVTSLPTEEAEPTLPPVPDVVPADPTPTQAAGGKPTLIFFTAPN
jgi:hypothetical protein